MPRSVSKAQVRGDAGSPVVSRAQWERPAFRQLAANKAEAPKPDPCNDGSGVGGCANTNHS
jgi:hypothetical protein